MPLELYLNINTIIFNIYFIFSTIRYISYSFISSRENKEKYITLRILSGLYKYSI